MTTNSPLSPSPDLAALSQNTTLAALHASLYSPSSGTTNANAALASLTYNDRLSLCWLEGNCASCVNSPIGCLYCAASHLCVAIPTDENNNPPPAYIPTVLLPLSQPSICPTYDDRWEVRARWPGCACSTYSFLAILVTIPSTILGLWLIGILGLILSWILWCTGMYVGEALGYVPIVGHGMRWTKRIFGRRRGAGWEVVRSTEDVEVDGEGGRAGREWVRRVPRQATWYGTFSGGSGGRREGVDDGDGGAVQERRRSMMGS